jgi:hypothetical protein
MGAGGKWEGRGGVGVCLPRRCHWAGCRTCRCGARPCACMSAHTQPKQVPVKFVKLRQGRTQPPPHLSEAELIGLMEKNGVHRCGACVWGGATVWPVHLGRAARPVACFSARCKNGGCRVVCAAPSPPPPRPLPGIGTDASISSHIQNICNRYAGTDARGFAASIGCHAPCTPRQCCCEARWPGRSTRREPPSAPRGGLRAPQLLWGGVQQGRVGGGGTAGGCPPPCPCRPAPSLDWLYRYLCCALWRVAGGGGALCVTLQQLCDGGPGADPGPDRPWHAACSRLPPHRPGAGAS